MTYNLLSQLGQGGFCTVFLAQDKEKGTCVAIKQPQSRWNSLEHERSILALLHHVEGISHLLTTIEDNSSMNNEPRLSLVLEYVEGTSFLSIPRQSLPLSTVLQYLQELFAIIANIHAHGVVHNDLHNGNILCGKDGHLYLIDFGLSCIASTDRMFGDEVAAMIQVARRWVRNLTYETTCPSRARILNWLDGAYEASRREKHGVNAASFLASWQQMLQAVNWSSSSTLTDFASW